MRYEDADVADAEALGEGADAGPPHAFQRIADGGPELKKRELPTRHRMEAAIDLGEMLGLGS